jgi:WD40 repeat protein/tetratricopeptide (TPR) repeat protein
VNPEEAKSELQIPDHELIRRIGSGSYGEVWLARNVMGVYRAVKLVRRDTFDDERPFEREYNGIRSFEPISRSHESQLDILHVGRREGFFYYVMELGDDFETGQDIDPAKYIPRTLHAILKRQERLSVEETLSLALALTAALENLHSHGLVHRDIKPSNIIYVHGVPKLADIGLVTGVDATKSFVGTEGFVPPEGPGSPQADIYGFGKVLYEACTGRDRKDFPELPTLLAELADRKDLLELNAIILQACRENPVKRYQSAADMRRDLLLLQSGKSILQLRNVEQRLARVTRFAAVAGILTIIIGAAYLYQSRHNKIVMELALRSRSAEKQSREGLVRLQVANGTKLMTDGRLAHALSWFAKALPNVQDHPARNEIHRMRIASVLANHPKLTHLFVHDGPVYRCAFTPDGRRLATHSRGDRINVFDLASKKLQFSVTGKYPRQEPPHAERYSPALGFSEDGSRLVVRSFAEGMGVEIFEMSNGKAIEFENMRMLDSVDGKAALVFDGKSTVQIMDVDTGKILSNRIQVIGDLLSGRITRNGKFCAVQTRSGPASMLSELRVWDTVSGKEMNAGVRLRTSDRYLIAESGQKLVVDAEHPAEEPPFVFNTATGKPITPTTPLLGPAQGFVVHPTGQWIILRGNKHEKQFWNIETDESVNVPLDEIVRHFDLSSDGQLCASTGDSGEIQVWNRTSGEIILPIVKQAKWGFAVTFSPEGRRLATGGEDQTVRIWDLTSAQLPRLTLRQPDAVTRALYTPDSQSIVVLTESGIRLWDSRSGAPRTPYLSHGLTFRQIRFSGDGKRFVTFQQHAFDPGPIFVRTEGGAWVWNMDRLESDPIGLATNAWVKAAELNGTGSLAATVSENGLAELWDPAGRLVRSMETNATDVRFIPNTPLLAVSASNGVVGIRSALSGALVREFKDGAPNPSAFQSLAVSFDGRLLAAGNGDQNAYAWETQSGRQLSPPLYQGGTPVIIDFSRDARFLLTRGPAPWTKVWKLGLSEPAVPMLMHGAQWTVGADFNPSGRIVGTCSLDGTARIWDAEAGDLIWVPIRHPGGATSIEFPGLSQECLTAGFDGTVHAWTMPVCNYSIDEIGQLAELLFAGRIDATGSVSPISAEKMDELYSELSLNRPDAFATNPQEYAKWHDQMADIAFEEKRWKMVLWHSERMVESNPMILQQPTADSLFLRRGLALAELDRISEAEKDFEHAVQLDSDNISAWDFWMYTLLLQNRTNEYTEACARVYQQMAWPAKMHTIHSVSLRLTLASFTGRSPNAIAAGNPAFDLLPPETADNSAGLGFIRGQLLFRSKLASEAIPFFEKALPKWPVQALFWLAMSHHRAGNIDKGRELFERGVRRRRELMNPQKDPWTERVAHRLLMAEAKLVLGLPSDMPLE